MSHEERIFPIKAKTRAVEEKLENYVYEMTEKMNASGMEACLPEFNFVNHTKMEGNT